MTEAQKEALKWLNDHGGDGVFIRYGRVLAMGDIAPHKAATWNALIRQGVCREYRQGMGRRISVTPTESKYEGAG